MSKTNGKQRKVLIPPYRVCVRHDDHGWQVVAVSDWRKFADRDFVYWSTTGMATRLHRLNKDGTHKVLRAFDIE